jgi:tetratricopeptide (TPR) repeat protein
MVIDKRHDHSFRVPRPDLTVELGTPNACNDCHALPHETPEWAAAAVRKWYGDTRPDDPHWAPAFAAVNRGDPEGEQLLVALLHRLNTPPIVKATALSLSNQYETPEVAALQQRALNDDDPLVRATAVHVLSGANSIGQFIALLGDRLTDRSRAVRLAAARHLVQAPRDRIDSRYHAALEKALDEYRASQQVNLERAAPHINLGMLERQLGNPTKAAHELRTAIRLESYLTGPRTELANLLAEEQGDADEIQKLRAEEADLLDRDAALVPDSPDICYRLGLLRYQLGEYTAASRALGKACELAPSNFDFRMTLALLEEKWYERDGDPAHYNTTVAALKKLAELRPNDPRTAQIFQRLSTIRQAKEANRAPPESP